MGCGSKKYPGAVGVDVSADTDADVVLDLDRPPYDGLETARSTRSSARTCSSTWPSRCG